MTNPIPFGLSGVLDSVTGEVPAPEALGPAPTQQEVEVWPGTPTEAEYPYYLDTQVGRFIAAGMHGDFQYGGGTTESVLGVRADDQFFAEMTLTPLGHGVIRINWNLPNELFYSWVAVCRSLNGSPVSVLEGWMIYKAPRSTAYSTIVDGGLPNGREVCYTLFVLSTDAIPRWIPTATSSIVVANAPWLLQTMKEQLPDFYWERDLLQAEDARIAGNNPAEPPDGQLYRFFELLGPELTTSKAYYDALVGMRDPRFCPSSLLTEAAKLVGGLAFTVLSPERLREVVLALYDYRKLKGTADAFEAIISAILNCPVEVAPNVNWVLDDNSSQEFYPFGGTTQPGSWWPGDSKNTLFQVGTRGVSEQVPGTARWMPWGEWRYTPATTTPAAGHWSYNASNVYLHQTDLHGVDLSTLIERTHVNPIGFFISNLNDLYAPDWLGSFQARTKTGAVYSIAHGAGFTPTYPTETPIRFYLLRTAGMDPVPIIGDGVLGNVVNPVNSDVFIRSNPPGSFTDPLSVRDYGIPIVADYYYLLSGYVTSMGSAIQVEAVIEFWDDKGLITPDRLTDRTYLNLEQEYDTYALMEAANVDYRALEIDPLTPSPGGALPGTIITAHPVLTDPSGATWARPWVLVQSPKGATRLVMRFYGVGASVATRTYFDAIQLERFHYSDLPREPSGIVDWDAIVPGPYQPARTINAYVGAYRRNLVTNPRAVGGADGWTGWSDPPPIGTAAVPAFLDANAGTVTTPDLGQLVTNEYTMVFHVTGPTYSGGQTYHTIASQWEAEGQRSWVVDRYETDGHVRINTSSTGNVAGTTFRPTPALAVPVPPDDEMLAVSVIFNDAGMTRSLLWQSYDYGVTWEPRGQSADYDAAVVADATSVVRIGGYGVTPGLDRFDGKIHSVEMRAGLDPAGGVLLWRFDAEEYTGGTNWTDPRGRAWTVTSGDAITPRQPAVPGLALPVESKADLSAIGETISVFEVDHPAPIFGAYYDLTPDQVDTCLSAVALKVSIRPNNPGRFNFWLRMESLDPDTGEVLHNSQVTRMCPGTFWTPLFHSFPFMVPKPFAARLYVQVVGTEDNTVPAGWDFVFTEVMVDDLLADLSYFDGDTPSVDEEFAWLGTPHESESAAWPLRRRRAEVVKETAEGWTPADSNWKIHFDDGVTIERDKPVTFP